MLKSIFIFILLGCCVGDLLAQVSQKKALFIIVDGISADVIEKTNTPNLDEIAQKGGYTHAYVGGEKGSYSETPTISAVGYNSLLTGTWLNKHNVWGNDIKAPNYQYWTLFRFLEEQYPEKETAVFSTWLDNRTKLIGEGLSETATLKLDYHFDGFEQDTVQFPHDKDRKFIRLIDEHVTNEAARYVRANGPDLSWVYLEYTDDMGHMFGDSQQMYEAVEIADDQVGRIWDAIQYREVNHNEDWLIIVTTDHGRDAETGKHHGGQSERERSTWIVTNAKNLNAYFENEVPGLVSIFPTIARHLELDIPREQAMEIDGVPIIGEVSLANPNASYENDQIQLSWKAMEKKGKVKIWLSTANHFKDGGKDKYQKVGEVPLKKEKYSFDVGKTPSSFYKIVLEGPHNFVNQWVVLGEENK
ncbi:alkaline phosphatase family protein [Catalinimonas niigatensis]|uniref:alkaline phosphatase family protein n=1 Tax=Catalinimonas niigatensis TaxID=1397264 RepID=UPI002AA2AA63|nr:alkaline phosphatase family protein [Catalinimonas niigatensis]WPP50176.1 alkaline phosphatase family protein [Catalinimonas niigatensis]